MPNLSDHKLYGKRILHVCSPVRWSGSKAVLETDSNWKVLMDTVEFLPMCHHYILIPERSTIPQIILHIAEYQYKSAFVADQEINLMACLVEIMTNAKFK